jgi:hypothetical protein
LFLIHQFAHFRLDRGNLFVPVMSASILHAGIGKGGSGEDAGV